MAGPRTRSQGKGVKQPEQPIEQAQEGGAGDLAPTGVSETEELSALSAEDQQAAIRSSMGGGDNYPYVDRTAIPMHERNMPAMGNSPLTEASQADLNPAFTAKAEDGGPVNENGEGVGTEPNAFEQQLAVAENTGGTELRDQVQAQQDEAAKDQMDVDAVNAAAQDRAPAGVDATTGQPEGQATPPGTPSGMEASPDGDGTQGADKSA